MKAVAMFSGGLDSILAVKLIQAQGMDVIAVNFTSAFFSSKNAEKAAKENRIKLKIIELGNDYIKMLRKPKHGYGAGINPCIDCKIFMLKKAKQYAKKIKAKFIITGDVLGERPMSQNMRALKIIEKEARLKGKIIRPLSAKLLPKTEAEKKAWINREKLMEIKGRSRKMQIRLAKKLNIKAYPSPAGGCLLTYKEFSNKLRDLFKHKKKIIVEDIEFLKVGRHFRFRGNKIIVGRNKEENKALVKLKNKTDYMFEVPVYGSPITILQGKKAKKAVEFAAKLTAAYSDAEEDKVLVKYGMKKLLKSIVVKQMSKKEISGFRVY